MFGKAKPNPIRSIEEKYDVDGATLRQVGKGSVQNKDGRISRSLTALIFRQGANGAIFRVTVCSTGAIYRVDRVSGRIAKKKKKPATVAAPAPAPQPEPRQTTAELVESIAKSMMPRWREGMPIPRSKYVVLQDHWDSDITITGHVWKFFSYCPYCGDHSGSYLSPTPSYQDDRDYIYSHHGNRPPSDEDFLHNTCVQAYRIQQNPALKGFRQLQFRSK